MRPLQLSADGGYQLRLGVLGVPLIMVPDTWADTRQSWTLGKVHFYFLFSQPKFLWCVPTLYRPTYTILRQLEKCFL
jgi:hypothetical protein